MNLVNEQNDLAWTCLHLVNHLAQPLLELALHARAGLQQPHIQRVDGHVAQRRRHIIRCHPCREAFHHGRFAHARLARQQRIVLTPAQQDIDDLANLVVASGDGVKLTLARLRGEIHRIFLERAALAPARRAHRLTRLSGLCAARHAAAVARGLVLFRRRLDDRHQTGCHGVWLKLAKLRRHAVQNRSQIRRFQNANQQVSAPNDVVAIEQCGVDPRALDRAVDVLREIHNRGRTTRQAIQLRRDVLFQHRCVQRVMSQDLAEIRILILNDLMHPVHQLHIWISSQLAGHRCRLGGAKNLSIELTEKMIAINF